MFSDIATKRLSDATRRYDDNASSFCPPGNHSTLLKVIVVAMATLVTGELLTCLSCQFSTSLCLFFEITGTAYKRDRSVLEVKNLTCSKYSH